MARDFKSCFCRKFRCPPEEFVRRAFWRSLHRRALLCAKLMRWLNPEFFSHDFTLIEEAASATEVDGVRTAIVEFYRYTGHKRSYWHNQLRFRISGRRLLKLAEVCFEESPP